MLAGKNKLVFLFLAALVLMYSCKVKQENFSHPYTQIKTLPGPEDMVLDTVGNHPRMIIACASRRDNEMFQSGIQMLDIKTDSVSQFPISNFPDSMSFNPHGIDLGFYKGEKILWVINHEDKKNRQSVIRLRLEQTQAVFDTVFIHPGIISPNDICDGGNGTFYFTNDASGRKSGFELLFKIRGGSIVYYNGRQFEAFSKKFSYPNGIIKFKDNLYFSTSRQNKIFKISLNPDGSMKKDSVSLVVKGSMWDNFSISGNHLICTSHTHPLKFLKHRNHEKHDSPCQVYSVNPVTNTKGIVYHSDGEAISAGSTAIYYNGFLYICQVFDPYILKVNLHNY